MLLDCWHNLEHLSRHVIYDNRLYNTGMNAQPRKRPSKHKMTKKFWLTFFEQVDVWEVGHFSLYRKGHMIDFETGLCSMEWEKIFQLFQFYFVEYLIYSNFSLNLPNKIFEIQICFA
jgi:hypothetical protein